MIIVYLSQDTAQSECAIAHFTIQPILLRKNIVVAKLRRYKVGISIRLFFVSNISLIDRRVINSDYAVATFPAAVRRG